MSPRFFALPKSALHPHWIRGNPLWRLQRLHKDHSISRVASYESKLGNHFFNVATPLFGLHG